MEKMGLVGPKPELRKDHNNVADIGGFERFKLASIPTPPTSVLAEKPKNY